MKHSWWITERGAWVIGPDDKQALYEKLLCPPLKFVLTLLDSNSSSNLLQLAAVNQHNTIKANTPLEFTINNIKFTYSVYELKEGLSNHKEGKPGKEPGVRELIKLLGPCHILETEKRSRGRPTTEEAEQNSIKKTIR